MTARSTAAPIMHLVPSLESTEQKCLCLQYNFAGVSQAFLGATVHG